MVEQEKSSCSHENSRDREFSLTSGPKGHKSCSISWLLFLFFFLAVIYNYYVTSLLFQILQQHYMIVKKCFDDERRTYSRVEMLLCFFLYLFWFFGFCSCFPFKWLFTILDNFALKISVNFWQSQDKRQDSRTMRHFLWWFVTGISRRLHITLEWATIVDSPMSEHELNWKLIALRIWLLPCFPRICGDYLLIFEQRLVISWLQPWQRLQQRSR